MKNDAAAQKRAKSFFDLFFISRRRLRIVAENPKGHIRNFRTDHFEGAAEQLQALSRDDCAYESDDVPLLLPSDFKQPRIDGIWNPVNTQMRKCSLELICDIIAFGNNIAGLREATPLR